MIEDIIQEVNEAQAEYQRKAKEAVGKVFKKFFEDYPEVKYITWDQYTPYFNDGDECVFGMNEVYFLAKTRDEVEDEEEYDKYDFNEEFSWYMPYSWQEGKFVPSKQMKKDMDSVKSFMYSNERIFQSVFGDHVTVTIMPDGSSTTEEYDHD